MGLPIPQDTPSSDWTTILRRDPDQVASAHAVEREYRVLKALQGSAVPVPPVYHLCEDDRYAPRRRGGGHHHQPLDICPSALTQSSPPLPLSLSLYVCKRPWVPTA